eukprot:CAMPEP_0172719692 /NCGR_PEP_ID=MMETSP1074-20121228/75651_1 /TAXON_ID=2916 /ORGANISM="Ceratium fusus, Strain PA161109" /LENGTH=176 /DNA_ID=CAMNT_0013545079 /DNA_START=858 /DNA_END=1388 /DNA_ORIENTATION=+
MESVARCANNPDTPFLQMFLTLFGMSLAGFLGLLGTAFFGFHIFLTLKARTCIELLEKSQPGKVFDPSPYDVGIWGNIRAILGDFPMFWLLPLCPPRGEGLSFVSDETRLTADSAAGGVRRRAHQTMQRKMMGLSFGSSQSMSMTGYGNFSSQSAHFSQPISSAARIGSSSTPLPT